MTMMKKLAVVRLILSVLMLGMPLPVFAQSATGTVRGTVTDPSGALVPQADVTVANATGLSRKIKSSASGSFEVKGLVPGRYSLMVSAKGFATAVMGDVQVFGDKVANEEVKLDISATSEVNVTADVVGVSVNPDENANSLVIKDKDLDALSDDPDELSTELTALAGPSAGPSGAQIYIDGFTGGQLPPKSSIREIRINRNPFSAQYDKLGYGRIEILTKPGTDKLHGSLMASGNDKVFNSLNPFVTSEPDYHSTFLTGNVGGAMGSKASWFGSVFSRNNASNSIIKAETAPGQDLSLAVANPQSRLDISPRFDFQLGATNTLTVRYSYNRQKQTNSGVGGFALQSQAYNGSGSENTVQISDTQVLSTKIVNDAHFQYSGARNSQVSASTDATVAVQAAFTGGGNSMGTVRDNQDRFEFQDYITAAEGKHALNFGTRLRLTHEVNSSTAGFNGTYIYTSLAAYAAGTPSEYDVTTGNALASVNLFDAGLFYQDDWTVRPNLTLSYGLRYESQNRISDHADWAPRFAVAYAPGARNGKKGSTVFRAGYGWFFDRFGAGNVLSAIHQNGVNQQSYVVKNPGFTTNAPLPSQLAALSTVSPTLFTLAPNLKAAVSMQAAFGVDHQFGKAVTLSGTYINSRGVHQYLSENINAFLPSTYNLATGTGVRPNGINENINQFQSGGVYNQNQLTLNYTVRAKKVSLFGFYSLTYAKADTSGAGYFSSNPTDPGADYGRANFDVRNRFLLGGNYTAPFGISLSPFLVANSGSPFNITIGQDINGDNEYNDRPAYATAASTNTMQTAYGDFDLSPAANAQRIAYNMETGPAQFSMNLRVAKTFGIGPKVEGSAARGGFSGGPGGGGPGGGHGGGPGGGLGPGGMGGNGGPPRLDQAVARRYSLTFSAQGRNVFNHVSLASPVGVLNSQFFGQSTAIAGGFFGSAASNRSIDLQASFNF
ncbi:MAG TPA: TonB-dependent receptor [Acidobacteriaceae bacterium]|jgi:hypothetical protein